MVHEKFKSSVIESSSRTDTKPWKELTKYAYPIIFSVYCWHILEMESEQLLQLYLTNNTPET